MQVASYMLGTLVEFGISFIDTVFILPIACTGCDLLYLSYRIKRACKTSNNQLLPDLSSYVWGKFCHYFCDGNVASFWFSIITEKKREPNYIPPTPSEDEEAIFNSMQRGINFDKYDEIPVECSGADPPTSGIST